MMRGNQSLLDVSGSHDQSGHHTQYMVKPFQNLLLLNQKAYDLETLNLLGPIIVCTNDDPGLTLTYFTATKQTNEQTFTSTIINRSKN